MIMVHDLHYGIFGLSPFGPQDTAVDIICDNGHNKFSVCCCFSGLCDVCPSLENPLMVLPGYKCGSIQLVVSKT